MSAATWVEAIGAIATPIVVGGVGFVVSSKLSRSGELLKVRLEYYRELAPDLNTLMCYMTFIGTWRDTSPADVVALKRRLDATFFCAAPLFSPGVLACYQSLMDISFTTFNDWGEDAKIRSNAYRRRQSWRGDWLSAWDDLFELHDEATISAAALMEYREKYDALVSALVRDLNINRARQRYTTDEVALNAHAPARQDVAGSGA
ncbi:MAG TPA: hypothetical protein VHA79_09230 [Mycobacteriales bacterium]|nr:hypothetical protein [Mycobacteriales bacterium]